MEATNLTLVVAFGAGVLSFVSPCVLPLVPAYVGHLAGRALDKEGGSRALTMLHAAAFVMGFTLVFTALGASIGLVGFLFQDIVRSLAFRLAAGAGLVVLGLHAAGVVRIGALYRDARIRYRPGPRAGIVPSFLVGVVFAAGWTPCVGPILGTILTLGLTQATVPHAALLLAAFSLGMGVPFLVTGYALDSVSRALRRLNRHGRSVEIASGVLMAAMGVVVAVDGMTWLAAYASRMGYTGI